MKKLIIIGNGFDLVHKRPTSYEDFIESLYNEDIKGKREFFRLSNKDYENFR